MPPISGMMMSIVTRSGFSALYFSTACAPESASPITSRPACVRMSPIIVRMNTASSHTSTVLFTTASSGESRFHHRAQIEMRAPFHIDNRQSLNVEHVVHYHARKPPAALHEQNARVGSVGGYSIQTKRGIHDRDEAAAQVDQSPYVRGRTRKTSGGHNRNDFANVAQLGASGASGDAEYQHAARCHRVGGSRLYGPRVCGTCPLIDCDVWCLPNHGSRARREDPR